jgi:predicted double-glycine peptidase
VSRTTLGLNRGQSSRARVLAAGTLAASVIAALGLAAASRNPMGPLRGFSRWTLERRGARFLSQDRARLQSSLDDCGPTALADLLEVSGLSVPSTARLRRLTATTSSGTTLANLASAADSSGLPVFTVRWDPGDLDQLPLPSLVWVDRRHFVVLARRGQGDSLEVHDPATGHYRMSVARFAELWSGAALIPIERISSRRGSED